MASETSAASLVYVNMIIGTFDVFLMAAQASAPLIRGMLMSSITRSGSKAGTRAVASRPSLAACTRPLFTKHHDDGVAKVRYVFCNQDFRNGARCGDRVVEDF